MKPINSFYLKIPSRSANESFARFAVSAFVSQLDPTLEELSDIKTAVSEAVTNSIVHAYKNEIGNVYITAEIYENRSVKIRIRDTGCGIDDVNKALEPLFTKNSILYFCWEVSDLNTSRYIPDVPWKKI